MKKISILIVFICLLLSVACNNSKEEIVDEGKNTPSINLIIISDSKYFTESEFIDEENSQDGYYMQSYKYENINFSLERMEHKEYSDFPVYVEGKKLYNLKNNNKSINDEMEMDLSYPVIKSTYITKENNEEIFNEDILISTEQWDFRIHFELDKDDYEKNASIINDVIKNIKIEEVG